MMFELCLEGWMDFSQVDMQSGEGGFLGGGNGREKSQRLGEKRIIFRELEGI